MTREVVVDTNVAKVANGDTKQASLNCVTRCIDELLDIRQHRCVVLDQGGEILDEYERNLEFSGQSPGDEFFRWLWDNQGTHSRRVAITVDSDRGFREFPNDLSLVGFHRKDRKFVAVALASGTNPEILNASDKGWWNYRKPLERHGVSVNFLCPELMPEQ